MNISRSIKCYDTEAAHTPAEYREKLQPLFSVLCNVFVIGSLCLIQKAVIMSVPPYVTVVSSQLITYSY